MVYSDKNDASMGTTALKMICNSPLVEKLCNGLILICALRRSRAALSNLFDALHVLKTLLKLLNVDFSKKRFPYLVFTNS